MKTQLLRHLPKLGGVIALSLSLALTACDAAPELDNVDADVDVPTDQGSA